MATKKATNKNLKAPPPAPTLSAQDKKIVELYLAGPDRLRGNAKLCYWEVHTRCKESTAETMGPRFFRNAQVKRYIDERTEELKKATTIDAKWVLEESVRLYRMCVGDLEVPDSISIDAPDGEGGAEKQTIAVMKRVFNGPAAKAALELVGRNVTVQAFKDNLEVTKVDLVEILRKRQEFVEREAKKVVAEIQTQ